MRKRTFFASLFALAGIGFMKPAWVPDISQKQFEIIDSTNCTITMLWCGGGEGGCDNESVYRWEPRA